MKEENDIIFSKYLLDNGKKTRKQFCKENNISLMSLKNWLSGKTLPRVDIAFKIEEITKGRIKAKDFCKKTQIIVNDK